MNQNTETNHQDLLKSVMTNEVNWKDARKIIQSFKKPWQTQEWKEKRKILLASQCENCGTTTPPLVLQHTWHPTPLYKLFYNARKKHQNEWLIWQQSHTIEIDKSSLVPNAGGCPQCGSTTIRYRKRANNWICASKPGAKPGGITCGNVFDSPIRVVSHQTVGKLERVAKQKIQDDFDEEFGIGKKVTITAIEHQIRYLSLKDTKTLCKRCAFVEDKTKMVLCNLCKANYHSKKYDRCSACAGIDTSKSQLKIE